MTAPHEIMKKSVEKIVKYLILMYSPGNEQLQGTGRPYSLWTRVLVK